MKNIHLIIAILIVVALILWANMGLKKVETVPVIVVPVATSTATTTTIIQPGTTTVIVVNPPVVQPTQPVQPTPVSGNEGTVALNKTIVVDTISITPTKVTEDSRCPANAQCIWTGRITVSTNINSKVYTLNEGTALTLGDYTITLKSVVPQQTTSHTITAGEYRFTFTVTRKTTATGACYVGGCSGQICSDQEGVASTCEYREVYSCYQDARCERQSSGQCGWTDTSTLRACIAEKS